MKPKEQKAWWINGVFVVITHIVGVFSLIFYTPKPATLLVTFLSFAIACLGITMGYHRLWSHRSYEAQLPLRILLAIMGTLGFQGSIKWWVLRHRIHHRFTDTDYDPYSATKGFWFSHIGWIFKKPYYEKMKLIDQIDLNADPVVVFQHKFFPYLAIFFGFVVPTYICSLWQDALGGYLYVGIVSRLAIWHATFCINSFAHWIGDQDYSMKMTPKGNFLLALLTMGEGYHNFHHEFPKDYRNGVNVLDYDPTKWLIVLCEKLGLATNLHKTSIEEIEKAKIDVQEQRLLKLKQQYNWGPEIDSLPKYSKDQYAENYVEQLFESKPDRLFIILSRVVYDVTDFVEQHPGGSKLLLQASGSDATKLFHQLNHHTDSAKRIMRTMAVGRL